MGPLVGSGFITLLIYASQTGSHAEDFDLLTENGDIILTEDGLPIEIEH